MSDRSFPVPRRRGAFPGFLGPLTALALAVLAPSAAGALQGAPESEGEALRLLTPDDYGRFESLGATTLSPDGRWLAASIGRVEGDGELRLHRTDSDSVIVFANGSQLEFSPDGRWAALRTSPGEEERRRLQSANRPVRNDMVLVDLERGETDRRPEVTGWEFSPDGRFVLMRRYRVGGNGSNGPRGADVVIRDLTDGTDLVLGNVAEARWSDEHPILAMIIDAAGMAGNGVRTYDAPEGTMRTLRAEEARFSGLTWRDESTDLAVFREMPDTIRGDTLQSVLAWRDVASGGSIAGEQPGSVETPGGEALRVTTFRGLRWSDDGERLFFAAVPREAPDEDAADEDEDEAEAGEEGDEERPRSARSGAQRDSVPGVEIWHAFDVDPVPQQRLRAAQTRRQSDLVAWTPEGGSTMVLGGREGDTTISLLPGERHAVLLDGRPYARERMFGPVYRDIARVDVATGEREPILERIEFYSASSPGGRYLMYFRDDHWHAYDLEEARSVNLTAELPGVFVDERQDHTVEQKRPHGTGGWLDDDRAVLIYDQYDVWRVAPDGTGGERLTRGAEEEIRHRVLRLDFDRDSFDPDEPIYLSLYGEWTKDSGYARLHPSGEVETLVYEPASIQRLARADDVEHFTYVAQRYDMPQTLHLVNPSFDEARTFLQVNPHVAESFLWGRSELIDYENEWGEPLQGALFYPADYEPGRRYPMIVYPYERRSQVLHSWSNPSDRSAYNTTVFTQNGYFVLQPDVVYRPRNPGLSFMEAVIPALDAAVATGMIDPDRIGLTGHSWGGYQTTFAVTQTDRFAAAVAGAPLTNLVSMYLSFYWNSGGTDARIFEISQGRMEVPWWEDFDSYRANSPVHHIQDMETPLLMAFGTEDGAVEFNQGVEFYNAARRLEKDFVLLVYEGENHSLQQRPNQIDYHRRSLEWFNHYLKGDPAPKWITDGIPYVEQEEKLKAGPAAGRVPGPR